MKFKFSANKVDEKHKDIEEIYKDDEGNKVDLTKIDRGSRSKHILIWLAGVGAVLLVVAGAGWYVFSRPSKDGGEVVVTINAPTEVASGDTIDLTVTYENKEKAGWSQADLALRLPNGFYVADTNPNPIENRANTWDLGSVPAGKKGEIHVRGQLVGAVGDEREFFALLTYQPENFKYDFQKTTSTKIKVTSSTIEANVTAPSRATNQDEIEFKVILLNKSGLPVEKARVYLEAPANFDVKSKNPDVPELQWDITGWDPSKPYEVVVKGVLSPEDGETQQFGLRVSIVNADGTETRQVESYTVIQVVNPELELGLAIDNSSEDAFVAPGDSKNIEVNIRNNSDLLMRDVKVEVSAVQSSLEGEANLFEEEFPITYTSVEYLELEEIKPNAEKTFQIPFHLLKTLTGSNLEADIQVAVKEANIDNQATNSGLPKAHITVKVPTTLDLSVFSRYYSDGKEEIGSGPLPPQAGETTEYAIFWTVENTFNQADGVTVTAELPEGVEFGEKRRVDEGTFDYNSATRTVTWTIEKISANTEIDAYFTVKATPDVKNIGTLVILTRVTDLKGKDVWANKNLTDTAEGVTSNLDGDPVGEGKGEVVE